MNKNISVNVKACQMLDVEITPDELLKGIINVCQLDYLFSSTKDVYWRLEKCGKTEVLNQYVNFSLNPRHPEFEVFRTISDKEIVAIYKCINKLKEFINVK